MDTLATGDIDGGHMLVGRDAELERIDRVLAAGKSARLLVTGPPNIGKSMLLRAMSACARKRHYRVVPDSVDDDAPAAGIVIDKSTTKEQLCDAMRIPLAVTQRDRHGVNSIRLDGSMMVRTREDLDQSIDSPGTDDTTTERKQPGRTMNAAMLEPQHESPSKGDITNPTLIIIDGYRPDKELEDWIIGSMIPVLREPTPVRIVVVAGFASGVSRLKPYATEIMDLEPPDKDMVAMHLQEINTSLRDQMSKAEIQHYARELSADPSLINALERILRLDA